MLATDGALRGLRVAGRFVLADPGHQVGSEQHDEKRDREADDDRLQQEYES